MNKQPNRNYISNDNIMTPDFLAQLLVDHFKPNGKILEPCKGTGVFLKYLPKDTLYCEIAENLDFMDFNGNVDWIITNPPYSNFRAFLKKSLEVSKNIVFLITINHLWTKARLRDIKKAQFGIKEILIFDTPENFPQSGFQFGVIYLQKNYVGDIIFGELKK